MRCVCVLGAGVDGQRILWQDLQLYSVSHFPKAFIYSSSWPVPAAAAAIACSSSNSSNSMQQQLSSAFQYRSPLS